MSDSETARHATDEFCLIWQNDQAVYNEVVAYTRDLLRGLPSMTNQTLGRNVKDRVFAWAYGGGWGYSEGWGHATSSLRDEDRYPDWTEGGPPPGYRPTPFSYFLGKDMYGYVSETRVGEEAREALGLESGDCEHDWQRGAFAGADVCSRCGKVAD
jgi:hypothetical protein